MATCDSEKKILAVDWGEKRLGLALSDPTQTLARPYKIIGHVSRRSNAERILEIACEEGVGLIIIGVTYDGNNILTRSGRSSMRLIEEIRYLGKIPVNEWDEDESTKKIIEASIEIKNPRKSRKGHLDSRAAAVILQSYLDSKREE